MSRCYEIFKGSAACRFTLYPPKIEQAVDDQGREFTNLDKKFCGILLELAPAQEDQARRYRWADQKIGVLLGLVDMGGLLFAIKNNQSWTTVHDPNMSKADQGKEIKKISFLPPSKTANWFLGVEHQKEGQETKRVGIPISPQELEILYLLVVTAVNLCTGFTRW